MPAWTINDKFSVQFSYSFFLLYSHRCISSKWFEVYEKKMHRRANMQFVSLNLNYFVVNSSEMMFLLRSNCLSSCLYSSSVFSLFANYFVNRVKTFVNVSTLWWVCNRHLRNEQRMCMHVKWNARNFIRFSVGGNWKVLT